MKNQNPKADPIELMKKAESGKLAGGVGGILENTLTMGVGLKSPISLEGKNVVGKFVKGAIESGLNLGTASAVTNAAVQTEGAIEGYKTSPEEVFNSSVDKFVEGATTGTLLHSVTQSVAGLSKLPKQVSSAFKYGLKDVPAKDIVEGVKMMEDAGEIPQGEGVKAVEDIEGYKQALRKVS